MNTQRTKKPLISVIMPVYNARKYVAEAIRSIQSQTVTNWELLIVDDGSTDGTRKILTRFAKNDSRIRLMLNEKNMGMAKSLNRLLPLTRGKYIARMDADDISLPHRFARQTDLLEKNHAVVACGGHEYIINSKGSIIGEKKFPIDPKLCRNIQLLFMAIQPPVLMTRGAVMRKLRYDTSGYRNGDDISMYFKLLAHGEFSNVDDIIFQYRILSNSTTHANVKKTYWMAFGVRIDAIKSGLYRPGIVWCIAFIAETLFIVVTPHTVIQWLFETLRHREIMNYGKLQTAEIQWS